VVFFTHFDFRFLKKEGGKRIEKNTRIAAQRNDNPAWN
jgi:hypothetical protein